MLFKGTKKRKDMKKKAKPMELVTVLLTWCDSIRGKGVKSEGEKRRGERKGVRYQVSDA